MDKTASRDISDAISIVEQFLGMHRLSAFEMTNIHARWIVRGTELRVNWDDLEQRVVLAFPQAVRSGQFRHPEEISDLDRYEQRIEAWLQRNVLADKTS